MNPIPTKTAYSLDDVLLRPQRNNIPSRLSTDVGTNFTTSYGLEIPIMATNMSTVTGYDMMKAMYEMGGVGALHRFMSIEETEDITRRAVALGIDPVTISVGVGDSELERAYRALDAGAHVLLIDIAHGHSNAVFETLAKLQSRFPDRDYIVGNIATYDAAKELLAAGASSLRVGIGGGSRCTTRTVTGHGVPNLTALVEVVTARDEYQQAGNGYIPVIIDGGIRHAGDIVKALYFGADVACLGGLLAGTEETPGDIIEQGNQTFKKYYGMASKEAQDTHRGGMKAGTAAEGISEMVPYRGSVKPIVESLVGGIRSGFTYSGARDIYELRERGEAMLISPASQAESKLR